MVPAAAMISSAVIATIGSGFHNSLPGPATTAPSIIFSSNANDNNPVTIPPSWETAWICLSVALADTICLLVPKTIFSASYRPKSFLILSSGHQLLGHCILQIPHLIQRSELNSGRPFTIVTALV